MIVDLINGDKTVRPTVRWCSRAFMLACSSVALVCFILPSIAQGQVPLMPVRLIQQDKRLAELIKACSEDNLERVKQLISQGASVKELNNQADRSDLTQNPEILGLLITNGLDIEKKDAHGQSPIQHAIRFGETETAKVLLRHNARCNDPIDGNPLICEALVARHHDVELIRLLLQHGADANAVDWNGRSAVNLALSKSNTAFVKLLLASGARVAKYPTDIFGASGNLAIFRLMLAHGGDIHTVRNGETLLMAAAGNRWSPSSTEVVRFLLQKGLHVNARNRAGWAALAYAATGGNSANVDILLKAGADPNSMNNDGEAPWILAAREGHSKALNLLLAKSRTARQKGKIGPLLFEALWLNSGYDARHKYLGFDLPVKGDLWGIGDSVRTLLHFGADPAVRNDQGQTPFLYAVNEVAGWNPRGDYLVYFVSALDALLAAGADIDAADRQVQSALIRACHYGCEKLAWYLVSKGASINRRDKMGRTALMEAAGFENAEKYKDAQENADRNHIDTVRYLLNAGADYRLKDNQGLTAYDIALKAKHQDIADSILVRYP